MVLVDIKGCIFLRLASIASGVYGGRDMEWHWIIPQAFGRLGISYHLYHTSTTRLGASFPASASLESTFKFPRDLSRSQAGWPCATFSGAYPTSLVNIVQREPGQRPNNIIPKHRKKKRHEPKARELASFMLIYIRRPTRPNQANTPTVVENHIKSNLSQRQKFPKRSKHRVIAVPKSCSALGSGAHLSLRPGCPGPVAPS